MRTMLAVLLLGASLPGMTAAAAAYDLGNQAPVKPVATYPENIPSLERQGGDTIYNAMIIPAAPLSPVWLWVGPTVFVAPAGAPMYYDYTVWFDCGVATEPTSWSTVKALFR